MWMSDIVLMRLIGPSDPKTAFEMDNWLQLSLMVLGMMVVVFSSVDI